MNSWNGIAVFADRVVGVETIEFLLKNFPDDIKAIVLVNEQSPVLELIRKEYSNFEKKVILNDNLKNDKTLTYLKNLKLNYFILAWWPNIIKEPVINIPSVGILNFHPSYLPYNKGRNYNFWTIVEDTPFGVTIHFIDNTIDGGDIIFQKRIFKTWEDTGATLYDKAQREMVLLFKECYPKIRTGEYERLKQVPGSGSFRLGNEINKASIIELDKKYVGRDLLNILRARTFAPHPSAWFEENGEKYEVRVTITKIK